MKYVRKVIDKPACWLCGSPSTRRIFMRPKLRGGREQKANLIYTCQRCEFSKGLSTLEEYREVLRRMLVFQGVLGDGETLRFPGEGGPRIHWPKPVGRRGRPRKPVEKAGLSCACGRWIPASQLADHLTSCKA